LYNFTFTCPAAVNVDVTEVADIASCCKIHEATAVTSDAVSNSPRACTGARGNWPAAKTALDTSPLNPIHTGTVSPAFVNGNVSWAMDG
jgi:hypothetical protein